MKRLFCALLSAALALVTALPCLAAGKEEIVYVSLSGNGTASEIYVVNVLTPENGVASDYGAYKSVRNMTSTDPLIYENGKITVKTDADTVFCEGIPVSAELPWRIGIEYFLDSSPIKPAQLAGKSGALDIVVSVSQNPLRAKKFFESHSLQLTLSLDAEKCKSISAPGATVARAGDKKQITFILLAGTEKTVRVSAEVNDFEMEGITASGVRLELGLDTGEFASEDTATLVQAAQGIRDGSAKLSDSLAALDSASASLVSGSARMMSGLTQMLSGFAADDALLALVPGLGQLKTALEYMKEQYALLDDGIGEYTSAVSALNAGSRELADGAEKFFSAVNELGGLLGTAVSAQGKEVSFVTVKNTDVDSVQFVIKAPPIKKSAEKEKAGSDEQPGFWKRILRIFGLD